ncbi:phosphopantetheine-binding protein [Micromonospora yasonensis]|uniref:beta-ketoacyl synthase N-terminal-like domain-containing protein n=1 Tax=Micromonospora yasonensis TaxID=1128667 RepID=UPI0022308819|nr:beta-ketoacyl synthase N-terminal-like domain-containing protein [Micromonospora yasonensis]MCW3844424.1 phosphopantetheine-binding protein [Micromonospora yasonensis]
MDATELRRLVEDQLRLSRRQQARIRELEREQRPPLAVVGLGLRFPGDLRTPEQFWDFLRGDAHAVTGIPDDRPGLRAAYRPGPVRPGRSYVDRAAFLSDIGHFDADFFGISQREAELLDPQQRLLLETAWEALERAGVAVRRADRLDVGVYLGMMASEYGERLAVQEDKTPLDPYYATGGGLCFGAGRISYVMGFAGPVVSVDTACSSSLVAMHLAVRALRAGECRYALVCGSNLLLSPNLMVSLCQSRALSPEGRSKSFLAAADGYGRGEGVGVLVLMRLDEAEREGRPILAVVRGSAVNHDGAASGLTVPSGPAQQQVVRAALADAGVGAADVGWVEAHGTGTLLGDPVEVGALDAALGTAVRERGVPLGIGSVKARLNHLEAASGVAGLMKTVLMLHHGEIPAAADESDGPLNEHIPWDQLGFTVPRRTAPWPAELSRRVAGVNSFGMSGTNAHVVLEAYRPEETDAAATPAGPELLTLSARDPQALATLGAAVVARLRAADPAELPSLCHTLRAGRAPLGHRVAVVGGSADELAVRLAAAVRQPAGPAGRLRPVTLWAAPDHTALEVALDAIGARWPRLVPTDPTGEAADRWVALLGRLGVRVRFRRDAGRPAGAGRLEWRGEDGTPHTVPLVTAVPEAAPGLLLDALAALFLAGLDVRFDALRPAGARFLPDLPTYPFRRRRFWVDEPVGAAGTAAAAIGGPDVAPLPTDRAGIEAYLMTELRDVLHAEDDLDPSRSFLETGGDSFVSTLFMTRIEERFQIALTPDDLPIDRPLAALLATIADHITGRPVAAGGRE